MHSVRERKIPREREILMPSVSDQQLSLTVIILDGPWFEANMVFQSSGSLLREGTRRC